MDDFSEPEEPYPGRADVPSSFPNFSVEIPNVYSHGMHPSPVQLCRDGPPALMRCDDGPDESLRDHDFAPYTLCCTHPYDLSHSLPQVPPILYSECVLSHSNPYHFPNPPMSLGAPAPHSWTPEGAAPCGMSSAELCVAVTSISSETADDGGVCSLHEAPGEIRLCNQTDLGVVCNLNGQVAVLNHPSPIPHPVVYTTLPPDRGVTQLTADVPPVSSSQTFLPPPPPPPLHPPPPPPYPLGYTFSPIPARFLPQSHPPLCPVHPVTGLEGQQKASVSATSDKSKKPCNCTKSQCLKLYCECFANGEICSNCKCINCYNNMEHQPERYRAIKVCLNRNKEAFRPKIDSGNTGFLKGRHMKGCNCKRSGCLKNYCECYEAKIMCSSSCKCVGCHNYIESPVKERRAWDSPRSTHAMLRSRVSCITPAVAEATCGCLLAQAEEAEKEKHSLLQAERMILEEFGQCLTQIVRSIFKHTAVQC